MRLQLTARQRTEFIAAISASNTNSVYNLPTQGGLLPMDRFMHSLLLRVRFRVSMPASNPPTGVNADAPYSIINRVVISGRHRLRGQQEEFINLRAADLAELVRLYSGVSPIWSVTPSTTATNGPWCLTASATNDVEFYLPIPFVPLRLPASVQDEYALDAPNYDNLKLDVYWGDAAQLFTMGSGSVTFSGYGSSSGSPEVRVYGRFYQAGSSLFKGFVPGRVWRSFTEVTGSIMTTTANGVRLVNVPKGYLMRSILLKTGVKAGTTSGNDAFLSLTDSAVTNIYLLRGTNKSIRYVRDLVDLRQEVAERYSIQGTSGYGLLDFVPFGYREEILDLRGLTSGPTGDTDVYLQGDVSGASGRAVVAVWEEWRYSPQLYSQR